MIWLWPLGLITAAIMLFPYLREPLRRTMGPGSRREAPGECVALAAGVTHFQWIGPRRGPVAVCVHGLTTPSFVWHGIAEGLAKLGYRVLIYDLYGRGFSDRPEGAQDRAFFLSQLEDLLEREGVEEDFLLLGYSMGGAIATAFAAAHPGKIRELVLIASAGLQTNVGRMAQVIRRRPRLGEWLIFALFPWLHRRGTEAERKLQSSVPGIVDLQQRELRFKGFVPAVLASLRGILSEDIGEDLRLLHRQGVPMLAIWGETDDVVPISSVGRVTELARSAKQAEIAGAGHGLPYTHTDEILDVIATRHRKGADLITALGFQDPKP